MSELAVGETLAAMGRHAEARQAFARSRAVAEALARRAARRCRVAGPARRRLPGRRGFALRGASTCRRPVRSWSGAPRTYDRLVRQGEDAGPANAPERYLRGRAKCSYKLAQWGREHGQAAGTTGLLERATADYEALTRRFPGDIDLGLALANCHAETAAYLKEYATTRTPGRGGTSVERRRSMSASPTKTRPSRRSGSSGHGASIRKATIPVPERRVRRSRNGYGSPNMPWRSTEN